jgi:hypothetical protein
MQFSLNLKIVHPIQVRMCNLRGFKNKKIVDVLVLTRTTTNGSFTDYYF